jgi:MFS family permease
MPTRDLDRRSAVLFVLLASLFTVSFTITLLVVTLNRIATDLDSTVSVISWSITGPMLAFGVVGPLYGKLGDLHGHKRVFVAGLAGAGLFAACTAVAWDGMSMVVFRTLSATAGAATGPATMAFITRLYGVADRVRPLGWWTFVNAGAPVLGVVAGAPLVEQFGWRAIFAVQVPLCAVGVVVAMALLPDTQRRSGVRFDLAGGATLGVGALVVLTAINQGADWGWGSPLTLGAFALGAAVLVWFVRLERRADEPLMPLAWWRTRNVAVPVVAQSLANCAYMGGFLLAPLLLDDLLGYSTSKIGLVVIARPLAFALVAVVAGSITVRLGERSATTVGTGAVVASMVGFALVEGGTATWFVVVALALSGVGFGVLAPALTSLIASAVDEQDLGVAGALQQLMSQLGAVLGTVIMTSVQQAMQSSRGLEASFRPAFVVGTGIAMLALAASRFVRSIPR